MNKDEKTLETKFKADGVQNVITKDGTVYNDVLSAMEQQATTFLDWADANNWIWNTVTNEWFSLDYDQTFKTTKELYNFFNNPTNGE